MPSIILHHFEASPFSEKIRTLLGYKDATWQSVLIPRIMPKPDLVALTGGYRKTPVMQIGRDLYCDTWLIARTVEAQVPTPPIMSAPQAASIAALEQMADRQLFLAAIPVLFRPAGRAASIEKLGEDYLARFQADRARLFSGGRVNRPDEAFSRSVWESSLTALESQLAGHDFLLGEAPTLADFAVYNPIWYVRGNAGVANTLDAYPRLLAWADRIHAFGHGHRCELAPADAIEIARQTGDWQPLPEASPDHGLDVRTDTPVTVAATDYGTDPVQGKLVCIGAESMVIEREGPDGMPLRVHFPRLGFGVCAAD